MIAHIYPSVLQAVSGRGYAGCLEGCFQGYRGEAMQDLGYELPRIPIPRTRVNKRLLVRRRNVSKATNLVHLGDAPTLTEEYVANITWGGPSRVKVQDSHLPSF